jgi:membrane associated rhomboid family serine protease
MSYNNYRPQGFSLLPEVVKNLLIINGIFFLITIVAQNRFNIDLNQLLGLHYPQSEAFRPYQLITYMFMHGSEWHIFLNMFALWMFGTNIENLWGGKKFLVYYILTGLGAAAIHYLVVYFVDIYPNLQLINNAFANSEISETASYKTILYNSLPPVVGASGAVYGILLAFGMMFPEQYVNVYLIIPIKAKYFVIIFGIFELYSGISNNNADNVAHFAHLGGMLFGFILIKYWRKRGTNY